MERDKIAIVGHGRIGKLVEGVLKDEKEDYIIIDPKEEKYWGSESLKDVHTAICFTNPNAGYETTKEILSKGVNAIVGTTKFYLNKNGSLNQEMLGELENLAIKNGVRSMYAPNFSPDVNKFAQEVKRDALYYAANGFRPVIMELHHNKKEDISGTAKTLIGKPLLEAYSNKDGLWFSKNLIIKLGDWEKDSIPLLLDAPFNQKIKVQHAEQIRGQIKLAESENKIPIIAIRHGDIYGTHRVIFIGESSVNKKENEVTDRAIFANGAYQAMNWALEQNPGLYNITDMIK